MHRRISDLPFDLAQGGESFDAALDRESIDVAQDREPVERPVESSRIGGILKTKMSD